VTPPRYDFTTCNPDYSDMSAETKDALHELVNAAGDRMAAMDEERPKERPKERCTNCTEGVRKTDQGFAFTCGSCGGTGWVYDDAALMVRSIRAEMEEEGVL